MIWSPADLEILRRHYPTGGVRVVAPLLSVPRTTKAIWHKVRSEGIRCERPGQMNLRSPWRGCQTGYIGRGDRVTAINRAEARRDQST